VISFLRCNTLSLLVGCIFHITSLIFVSLLLHQIYTVSSKLDWTIFTPNPYLFSAKELYYFEKTTTSFLADKINNSPYFNNQQVILIDFQLIDQLVESGKVQTVLAGEVTMTYGGKTLDSFSDLLPIVITDSDAQSLLNKFIQGGFFGPSSVSSNMKFDFNGSSFKIANNGLDSYAIVFAVLLTISGMLALASLTVFFSTKYNEWRQRQPDIMMITKTKTEDTEDPDSPGVLGAHIKSNKDVVITPARNIHHQLQETPASEASVSTTKSVYSTTSSKAPLGIMSMGNLKHLFSPDGKKFALYDVGLDDDDEESHNTSVQGH